jgi:hypothetical protein
MNLADGGPGPQRAGRAQDQMGEVEPGRAGAERRPVHDDDLAGCRAGEVSGREVAVDERLGAGREPVEQCPSPLPHVGQPGPAAARIEPLGDRE